MRLGTYFILLCFVLLCSCQPTQKTMTLYVTVDWEGDVIDADSIEDMQAFRQQFPHIPMLQLLNPAYFVRPEVDAERLVQTMRSTMLPNDTVGLHVHAWKSLINHCGISYQHEVSFADKDEACQTGDCGYTVSLEYAYSQQALNQLIACSSDILVQHGFVRPVHFRAGGWQMGAKLASALEANGFIWDSSEIDADLLLTRWHPDSSMIHLLKQLHPHSTPLSQPYQLTAQIMEYPNNAALADYTTAKQIVTLFKDLLDAEKNVMVLGFHQETATDYIDHLAEAVPQMEAIAKENNVQLVWASR